MKNAMQRPDRARLEAILVAALHDNEDWRVLTELALAASNGALAQRFAQALAEERRHLANVRAWAASDARRRSTAAKSAKSAKSAVKTAANA